MKILNFRHPEIVTPHRVCGLKQLVLYVYPSVRPKEFRNIPPTGNFARLAA